MHNLVHAIVKLVLELQVQGEQYNFQYFSNSNGFSVFNLETGFSQKVYLDMPYAFEKLETLALHLEESLSNIRFMKSKEVTYEVVLTN